jgi:MYXO-CTERM domain-containing protein
VNETACIGTQACCVPANECQCGRTTINSYERLGEILGFIPTPPILSIITPRDRDVVPSAFMIELGVEDDDGVALVELTIDTEVVATKTSPPFVFTADPSLRLGIHTVSARAQDAHGASAVSPTISVVRGVLVEGEVDPESGPTSGCQTTDTGGFAPSGLALLAAAAVRRRRRRTLRG